MPDLPRFRRVRSVGRRAAAAGAIELAGMKAARPRSVVAADGLYVLSRNAIA
jgi:hypothetical protein